MFSSSDISACILKWYSSACKNNCLKSNIYVCDWCPNSASNSSFIIDHISPIISSTSSTVSVVSFLSLVKVITKILTDFYFGLKSFYFEFLISSNADCIERMLIDRCDRVNLIKLTMLASWNSLRPKFEAIF